MADLTRKYRLIWDISTLYIQNDYEMDYSGSATKIINSGNIDFYESDIYQDILDKITQEGLQIDPSLN
jgi:hypothetical protein